MRLLLSVVRGRPWVAYGLAGPLIALIFFGKHGFLGAIISFWMYETLSAPAAGERNRIERYLGGISVSIRFRVGRLMIHLHHWLMMIVLLFTILAVEEFLSEIMTRSLLKALCGGCVGGTAQGLRYSDRFLVIRRRQLSLSMARSVSNAELASDVEELIMVDNNQEDFIDIELFSDDDEPSESTEFVKDGVQFHVDLFGEASADVTIGHHNPHPIRSFSQLQSEPSLVAKIEG